MASASFGNLGALLAKLRSLTREDGIDLKLPGLVVIGAQSAGKSSVLQAIAGLSEHFLPSGDGIVTRVPVHVQLRRNDDAENAYASFDHTGSQQFSMSEARQEILRFTSQNCPGKDVRDEPIYMTIHRRDMVDLLFTDLPGLTEIAVDGQPSTLPESITALVKKYAQNKECVLMAVTSSTADIATSSALKLAREADPCGERVVGILTKMDMLPDVEAVRRVLDNCQHPLKHGYFGLICKEPSSWQRATAESAFREKNRIGDVRNFGIDALAKGLANIFKQAIAKRLPDIQGVLLNEKRAAEQVLKTLRDEDSEDDRMQRGIRICQQVGKCLKDVLSGSAALVLDFPELVDSYGVVTLRETHKKLRSRLQMLKLLDPSDWQQQIEQRLMANAGGTNTDASMTLDIIKELLSRRVSAVLPPICSEYADSITKAVRAMVQNFVPTVSELSRYPFFKQRIMEVLMDFLNEGENKLRDGIEDYIRQEVHYINLLEMEDEAPEAGAETVEKRSLAALASFVFGKQKGSELLKSVVSEYEKRLQMCVPHFVVGKAEYCLILPLKAQALTKLLSDFTKQDVMLALVPEDRDEIEVRRDKRQKVEHIQSTLKELDHLVLPGSTMYKSL
eukprot:TRINITY_DN36055_c0_g1_i1.p1 TRINITY_DN36055_c0_g1~~TRINITY_DN36055_c0_g1_i1.p1  ORF type:complete len:619 (+),score=148.68 TRINITY_DN36055_c0_g1_i1:21-1877(+)